MAVIPITKGQPSPAQGGAAPSETSMLMALAEMHKQGRFKPKASAQPDPKDAA